MEHCLFCRIVRGDLPAEIVWQDEDCVAFRDINPAAPRHVLVIPRRHLVNLTSVGEEDRDLLGRLCLVAAAVARQEGLEETGWRVVMNSGPDAGQSVDHLHLHVLGGRPLAWPPG